MAWTNLHVSGYFNTLPGLTHPRQLVACCLRSNSNEEFRWSCWSCQLHPQEAQAAGFSPSKSCWATDAQQLYHWWEIHAKQSHWDWVREAESHHISHHELMCFLLDADLREWPLPWTAFALKAIPRELPHKVGGHNPKVFGPPFHRKLTPLCDPSEQHSQAPATTSKHNRLISPTTAPARQTQLGWTDPLAAYSGIAPEELTFLLQPFESLKTYGEARIKWHQNQCHMSNLTDFFLFIEQHTFFLLFIKLVGCLALHNPEKMNGDMRESVLGQLAVCPSQLKEVWGAETNAMKVPMQFVDYADWIYSYMLTVLELPVPITGDAIPRPPAAAGIFPPYKPSTACPRSFFSPPAASSTPATSTSASTATSSKKRSSARALEDYERLD